MCAASVSNEGFSAVVIEVGTMMFTGYPSRDFIAQQKQVMRQKKNSRLYECNMILLVHVGSCSSNSPASRGWEGNKAWDMNTIKP